LVVTSSQNPGDGLLPAFQGGFLLGGTVRPVQAAHITSQQAFKTCPGCQKSSWPPMVQVLTFFQGGILLGSWVFSAVHIWMEIATSWVRTKLNPN
jgi:hypothetical protein